MTNMIFVLTLSVCEDGRITVGKAVSTELFLAGLEASEEAEDSSMESEAMVPGAGVGTNEAGIFVGGCCFFLIISL